MLISRKEEKMKLRTVWKFVENNFVWFIFVQIDDLTQGHKSTYFCVQTLC